MRIAFVDYVGDPAKPGETGLSDLVWDMAGRLAHLGDDVHVIAPYTVDRNPDPAVNIHSFPLPPIAYRNIAGHILIVLAAYRRLHALDRFDIVHVPEYLSAAILSTLMRTTPIVLTEPGNIFERVARGNPYDVVSTEVFKLAARIAAKRCAGLIATSEEMAGWWSQTGFSPERIYRLPLGIDGRLFHRVDCAKAELSINSTVPAIMFAARLSRENGVDVALRALGELFRAEKAFHAHILGDGPEREKLEDHANTLGIGDMVTWHGWVDFQTLPTFYSAADIFVFSGNSGGTPRVLLQAMACGAPVIASAIGGIVDHVVDGENGLLFPPNNSSALSAAIVTLLDHPVEALRLGVAAAAYAQSAADWDILVPRLRAEVYMPLIASSRSKRSV